MDKVSVNATMLRIKSQGWGAYQRTDTGKVHTKRQKEQMWVASTAYTHSLYENGLWYFCYVQ